MSDRPKVISLDRVTTALATLGIDAHETKHVEMTPRTITVRSFVREEDGLFFKVENNDFVFETWTMEVWDGSPPEGQEDEAAEVVAPRRGGSPTLEQGQPDAREGDQGEGTMKWVLGKIRQPREVANAIEWRLRTLARTYAKSKQLRMVRQMLIILGEYERQLVAEGVEEDLEVEPDEENEEESILEQTQQGEQ
jgi:hypothetical protein